MRCFWHEMSLPGSEPLKNWTRQQVRPTVNDTIGCQRKIVEKIVEQGGNYLLALKANQGKSLRGGGGVLCQGPKARLWQPCGEPVRDAGTRQRAH